MFTFMCFKNRKRRGSTLMAMWPRTTPSEPDHGALASLSVNLQDVK